MTKYICKSVVRSFTILINLIKNQNYGLNDCLILIFLQIYQKIFKAYLVNISMTK